MIDNFSRRILAWRVTDTFAPVNSVAVLLAASQGATPSETAPVVLADAGIENVNAQVDDLVATGIWPGLSLHGAEVLELDNRSLVALPETSMALPPPAQSVATVRPLVAFYVHEHNHVLPHSAFRGQTPEEMYFGTGDAVPTNLRSRAAAARPRPRVGQPIDVLRDVPVPQRGRMTPGRPPFRPWTSCARAP